MPHPHRWLKNHAPVNWFLWPLGSRIARLGSPDYAPFTVNSFDDTDADLLWIDHTLPCLFISHSEARHVVMFFHGNCSDLGEVMEDCKAAREAFCAHVVACEYPGYGMARGSACESSVRRAAFKTLEFVTAVLGVPPEKLVVIGHSIGTGPAVEVAHHMPGPDAPAMLVVLEGYSSLKSVVKHHIGPLARLMSQRFPSVQKIGSVTCPVFLAHGGADSLIPLREAELLASACTARHALERFPGLDHCEVPFERMFELAVELYNSTTQGDREGSHIGQKTEVATPRAVVGVAEGPVLEITIPKAVVRGAQPRRPSKLQRLRRWRALRREQQQEVQHDRTPWWRRLHDGQQASHPSVLNRGVPQSQQSTVHEGLGEQSDSKASPMMLAVASKYQN